MNLHISVVDKLLIRIGNLTFDAADIIVLSSSIFMFKIVWLQYLRATADLTERVDS
jgi:hypothetical protein